jgi:hypothetical protein
MLTMGVACTGGDIKYGQFLRRLKRGSRVFLYVNQVGVVAEGIVESEWKGRANSRHLVWMEGREYTVGVRWIKRASEHEAVALAVLKSIGVSQYHITVSSISPSSADEISARLPGGISNEPPLQPRPRLGGGFGNNDQNREVESAAIEFVRNAFAEQGWDVTSVEVEKCGYDLRCTAGRSELHVEVKGSSGDGASFIITANEVRTAELDELFRLCVVRNALSEHPSILELTGKEFLGQYQLCPSQYYAILK